MREAGPKQTKPSVAKDNISMSTSPFLPSRTLAFQNCSCPPPRVCSPARARLSARTGQPSPPTPLANPGARGSPRPRAQRWKREAEFGTPGQPPSGQHVGHGARLPSPCHLGLGSSVPSSPPHSPGPLPPAPPANLGSAFWDDRHAPARGSSGQPSAPPGSPLPPASPPPSTAPAPLDAAIPGSRTGQNSRCPLAVT